MVDVYRRQNITWCNTDLFTIWSPGTNFNEILKQNINIFISLKLINVETMFVPWWPHLLSPQWVNVLGQSDTIWRHRSGSGNGTKPFPFHSEIMWPSLKINYIASDRDTILYNEFESHTFKRYCNISQEPKSYTNLPFKQPPPVFYHSSPPM